MQSGYALLCGETKLSTVFKMRNVLDAPKKESLHRPVEQCLYYCIDKGTRYGFIVTDEEVVVLRIGEEILGDGIASQRPRRPVPPQRYSYASSSMASSSQAMSVYSNSTPFSPRWVQHCVIPWSATKGLTVCLALFWLTLMAHAPSIDINIEDRYDALDRWIWAADGNRYRNNTSGRVRTKLKAEHVELVVWKEVQHPNGKYFYSHKYTTFIRQFWDGKSRSYYYSNYQSNEQFRETPQGKLPSLLCLHPVPTR